MLISNHLYDYLLTFKYIPNQQEEKRTQKAIKNEYDEYCVENDLVSMEEYDYCPTSPRLIARNEAWDRIWKSHNKFL